MFKGIISFWILPLFAACTWFGTLLAMLIVWICEGSPHYTTMDPEQHIAYISDIGAQGLQPLFIAGSCVCVVVFDVAFLTERYLRHNGRLAHNTTRGQKALSICACIAAVIGALGLIFLSIFDVRQYHHVHDAMLCVFIAGYIISAIFICAEYQRLGMQFREYRVLRMSFWVKLAFIFIEIALVIAFGIESYKSRYNRAAVLEWVISLFYIFYVASFVMDFLPAVHTKHNRFPPVTEMGMAETGDAPSGPSVSGGPVYTENYSNGSYASTQPIQEPGRYYQPPATAPPPQQQYVAPSRNF